MIRFEILTLFPRMVEAPLSESVLGKAQAAGHIEVAVRDIRDYAEGKHRVCDDSPYGGGAGMVMKPEPLVAAIEAARAEAREGDRTEVVLLSPQGPVLDQAQVRELARIEHLVLVCGRYEGVDERVLSQVDREISLGDFILTGGEFAAIAIVDAVSRLQPGVLGNEQSATSESFEEGLLEYPQYTRPVEFRGQRVPHVLLSGDHARIARWRRGQALLRTQRRRPDLFSRLTLSDTDRQLLEEFSHEELEDSGDRS